MSLLHQLNSQAETAAIKAADPILKAIETAKPLTEESFMNFIKTLYKLNKLYNFEDSAEDQRDVLTGELTFTKMQACALDYFTEEVLRIFDDPMMFVVTYLEWLNEEPAEQGLAYDLWLAKEP